MGGEYDVTQTVKIMNLIADGGVVAEKMIKQPGPLLLKLGNLMQLSDELIALATLDSKTLKLELGELVAADRDALEAAFKAKFVLQDVAVEGLVEEGLHLTRIGGEFVKSMIEFAKKIQAASAKPA